MPAFHPPRGFALPVSLALMMLMALLAIAMLGMSSIALRSSRSGESMATARANARLALVLAVGQLQSALGPDQRISARASVVHGPSAGGNLLGAWKSWRWDPDTDERPGYAHKRKRFIGWLASTPEPEDAANIRFPTTAAKDPVWLIPPAGADPPNADGDPGLRAGRVGIDVAGRAGGLAYAVVDESQMAPLDLPAPSGSGEAGRVARRTAPARPAPEVLVPGLDPDRIGNPRKLLSYETAVLAAGEDSRSELHAQRWALSTHSLGLLTNVAEGGLRTDLTTLFEGNASLESALGGPTPYATAADGAPRWDYLRSHYRLHRRVHSSGVGTPGITLGDSETLPHPTGIDPSPGSERLLPVIAKLQIMFSVVSHHPHVADRVAFFDTRGNPRGVRNYGAPHLVYDPVITLWNPYDVAIELARLRVRIWDPPVTFGFTKNGAWLRPENEGGTFHGLARFQAAGQHDESARRFFTLLLRDPDEGGRPGRPIRLGPGEVRVFSPWVEPLWTWGFETRDDGSGSAFFDWNADSDFGNADGRPGFGPLGRLGIQAAPGWDPRAGLQTDFLSYRGGRPSDTRYPFELEDDALGNRGWLGIRLDDTFGVHARPERTLPETGVAGEEPDFKVELLAGRSGDPARDILRSYRFRFDDVASELGGGIAGEISREFLVGDILQQPDDPTAGGKSPFAILTMSAKTTLRPGGSSKPWAFNHPVHEGGEQDSRHVGSGLDTYDLRLEEVAGFNTFPGVEWDPATGQGYYGATSTSNRGVSHVPMFHVPLVPASSLGDLVSSNLVATASLPRVTHALGNARAHPLLPTTSVTRDPLVRGSASRFGRMLDHSYLLNDTLWDRYYFSTIASYHNELAGSENRTDLLEDLLAGRRRPLNPRIAALVPSEAGAARRARELDRLDDAALSRHMATVLGVEGAFNLNSDSVGAWRALLSSARDAAVLGWNMAPLATHGRTGFPRVGLPLAGDSGDPNGSGVPSDLQRQRRWAGFRALSDAQIENLATKIVEQIRFRGRHDGAPSLTIGEFVNRRIGPPERFQVLQGLLQRAIDLSGVNQRHHQGDSKVIDHLAPIPARLHTGAATPQSLLGHTADGAPPILSQGDLMMALAPVVSVRGDTFRVRAYGEARDAAGEVTATAWCEALVQRVPEYVDPVDRPETPPGELESHANRQFGRRLVMTSFRWLTREEMGA